MALNYYANIKRFVVKKRRMCIWIVAIVVSLFLSGCYFPPPGAPAPVVVRPAPVVVRPAPVVVRPAPIVVRPVPRRY